MKKMLLIPLIATSLSLLTGCQEKPTVSLKQWLTDIEEDSFSYFHIKESTANWDRFSFNDYEYKVAEIIKNNISSISLKKTTPDVEGDGFTYTLYRTIGNYNSLYLRVYENCILMSAYGKKNDESLNQYAEYSIPKKDAKAMIEAISKRFKEMNDIYIANNNKADAEATLDLFYAEMGKQGNTPTAYFYDNKQVKDTSLNLLDDIKNFDFEEIKEVPEYAINYKNEIYYGIRDNYLLRINKVLNQDWSIVELYRYFRNPANPFYREMTNAAKRTYKVSHDKVDAFIEKVKAL